MSDSSQPRTLAHRGYALLELPQVETVLRRECHHRSVGRDRRRAADLRGRHAYDETTQASRLRPGRIALEEERGREAGQQSRSEPQQAPDSWRFGWAGLRIRGRSEPAELDTPVADISQTFPRVLGQAALDEVTHRFRKPAPVGLGLDDGGENVGGTLGVEGLLSGQALVEAAAERPDVGPLVDGFAARLLRAHVGGRPDDDAG